MVINFLGLDKFESNHTGDGHKYEQTMMEVRTGNMYEFLRSNIMNPGGTERRELMPRFIIDTF